MPQFNPKAIGTCVPGASVAFVKGPCANGWAQPHYESWGSETDSEDPEPVPPQTPGRILEMPGQVFKILDTSSDTRMVSIEYQGAPLWVNAELLSCGSQPNMSGYVAPHPHAGKDCSYQKLPLDPVSLARLNNDAQAELGLQIVAKAVGYKEEVRKNVAHDNKAMNDAFFDEKRTVDDKDEILTRALKRLKALDKRAAAIYGKNCKPDGIKAATYEIPRERGERMCRTFRNAKKQLEKIMKLPTKQARVTAFENRSFDSELAEDPENMQVSTRSIIYYGLDLERSDTTLGKEAPDLLRLKRSLKLVNRGSCDLTSMEYSLKLESGGCLDEVHNGYLYGATGKPGDPIECAGFALNYVLGMSRVADVGGKGPIPAVPDFEAIHKYLSGESSLRPTYFSEYLSCFQIVDVRKDQWPAPGDFVSSHGHIVIVERYDPASREVSTVEAASGKCSSVCTRTRPLFEPACTGTQPDKSTDWSQRPQRSDLRVMRYAPKARSELKPGELPCPIHFKPGTVNLTSK